MSTAVSTHTGAGPLSLMSCVRESSPPQDIDTEYENEKNVGGQKKKRFWNKWFGKRKNKVSDDASSPNEVIEIPKDSQRSRSTSELSETEEPTRRRNGTPMHPGLSVSHDSVFHSPHSGSEIELEGAQSSSSLSIHHQHHTDRLQTELTERLRLRRGRGDTSEDDEGLPRSPCNSPTATDKTAIKDNPKSHSTCSEASLLSVGSSEMDEDSFGQHSIHSSKLSLEDKSTADDFDLDLGLKNSSAPLNHSGARHKASVKPQRRYGAPRKKRLSGSVLPTTPEVNEESAIRSITPEISTTKAPGSEASKLNRSRSNAGAKYHEEFATLGEEDEGKDGKKSDSFLGRIFPRRSGKKKKSKEEKIISTSSSALASSTSLVTTTTNASRQTEIIESSVKEFNHTEKRMETSSVKPIPVPRSGPAARQRIQPNDIPASPELSTRFEDVFKSSPDRHQPASPLQIELENHLQQRLASLSTSPKLHNIKTPPISPKLHRSPLISPPKSPLSYPKVPFKSHLIEKFNSKHSRSEEIRSKVIITGLSPFQQRAVNNNNVDEDDSEGFKSLNDLPTEPIRPSKLVAKSHSFKINNNNNSNNFNTKSPVEGKTTFAALASRSTHEIESSTRTTAVSERNEFKTDIKKTISLDSIKNLDSIDANNTNEIFEDIKTKQFKEVHVHKESHPEKVSRSNSQENPKALESPANLEMKEETECKNILERHCTESKEFSAKVTHLESKEFTVQKPPPDITEFINNGITISGPRHKAVVSVINHESSSTSETNSKAEVSEMKQIETHKEIKEQQISVTKIQVKQESTQICNLSKSTIPEFMNIQLHKVEKPINNVILTAGFHSPKTEEQNKKAITDLPDLVALSNQTLNISKSHDEVEKESDDDLHIGESARKFSTEEIEIVERNEMEEKHVATALVTITTMTPPVPTRIFKKNEFQSRKSLVSVNNSEKPILKAKSSSLDIVESIKNSDDAKIEEKSDMKAKTQSVNDLNESINSEPNVPLRRKSMANKQKQEDEPELMKVFARRSLKLKDNESESLSQQVIKMMEETNAADVKSRDSDKENQIDSPSEERKKIIQKEVPKFKEPLLETKFVETTTEVTLRKPISNNNNKLYNYQRTVSLNNAKTNDFNNYEKMQKQNSFGDRPKTEHWITYKTADVDPCTKICQEEILTSIAEKTLIEEEFCTKPKNFNQRKAEWEKRAQEASRKTTP